MRRPEIQHAYALPLRGAVRLVPAHLRARLQEEWLAELPFRARLGQALGFALGCCWAAAVIRVQSPAWEAPAGSAGAPRVLRPVAAHERTALARRPGYLRTPACGADAALCEINTTPLIDVMLVLLVALIMSLPVLTHAVKLELPAGVAPPVPPASVVEIDIDADGTIARNGTAVAGLAQLDEYLHRQAAADPGAQIHLHPDRRTRYDVVAQVLAATQRSHLRHVGFAGTSEFR
ncbi:MAG TPA: biopolymer transporter ExbD [Steroidobacteraceae bacterium]|nr:biopolymer transporter ExbD [Steroidobacteraceae bacterium]